METPKLTTLAAKATLTLPALQDILQEYANYSYDFDLAEGDISLIIRMVIGMTRFTFRVLIAPTPPNQGRNPTNPCSSGRDLLSRA